MDWNVKVGIQYGFRLIFLASLTREGVIFEGNIGYEYSSG